MVTEDTREALHKKALMTALFGFVLKEINVQKLSFNQALTLRPARCQLRTQHIKTVAYQTEKKN